ncbi:MAG TPA: fumarylacetoacetate hydrolase family protein [Actinomycetota bacterium]|nr:fumarylacetoacetate hydrolase family protein [Actinomycetota bacterium]
MRFARFKYGNRIAYGILQDGVVEEISSTPFLPYETTGVTYELEDVRLLSPCVPSKVIGIALNYKDHVQEMGKPAPDYPIFFYKPSTAVVGPGDRVVRPPGCKQLDYEGELAVVVGSVARRVSLGRHEEVVLGYTCGIDATARDLQKIDSQWGRAKGFDTSAPLGPWIETDIDPSNLELTTSLNGEVRQSSTTSGMIFNVSALVTFVSAYVTLLPGDVILTGTPSGIGPMEPGDSLSVEIEGIGVLDVTVADSPGPR